MREQTQTSWHWSAVITGALVGVALQLTLSLMGLSLGLIAIGPSDNQTLGPTEIPGAVGAWWTLTSLVALLLAGATAGAMAAIGRRGGAPADDWDLLQPVLLGVTIWAGAALVMTWIATTTLGAAAGGVYRALVDDTQNVERQIRLVIDRPGGQSGSQTRQPKPAPSSQGNRSADARRAGQSAAETDAQPNSRAVRPRPAGRADDGSVVSSLQVLSWFAVQQAAEQLDDPQVQAALRSYAVELWQDTQARRERLAAQIESWAMSGAERDDSIGQDLVKTIAALLSISASEADSLIEEWRKELARLRKRAVERIAGGAQGDASASGSSQVAQDETGLTSALSLTAQERRALQDAAQRFAGRMAARLEQIRQYAVSALENAGFPNSKERAEAIDAVRELLQTTRSRAETIVARWETRARNLARALQERVVSAGSTAADVSLAATDAALDRLAVSAAYITASLGLGLLAAICGAWCGAWLAARQP